MMNHENKYVLVIIYAKQSCADGHLTGDIETHRYELGHNLHDVVRGDFNWNRKRHRLGCRKNLLVSLAIEFRIHGPQNFVPCNKISDSNLQGSNIQAARQSNGQGEVVHCRSRFETVQEPHSLLRQRQRNSLRPDLSNQSHPVT
eukprot:gene23243-biopygen19780